jgi:hypothetical protein
LDLQKQAWTQAFNLPIATALVVVAGAAALVVMHRSGTRFAVVLPGLPGAILAAASLAAVGLTVALLALDAARSPWSLTRQNLEVLKGRTSCGLAQHLEGAAGIARSLAADKPTLLEPSVAPFLPCATPAGVDGGLIQLPSLFAFGSDAWPVTLPDAPFAAFADLYQFETEARGPAGVTVQKIDAHIPGFRRLNATRLK